MDYKIIWSSDALEDIEAIGKFIARDSEFYAESTIQKIFETPQSLIQHPKIGGPCQRLAMNLFGNYLFSNIVSFMKSKQMKFIFLP